MSMELKRSKTNNLLLLCFILLLMASHAAGAEKKENDTHYWVQIGALNNDLASIQKTMASLPDGIEKDALRICMAQNGYALVHTGATDTDTAYMVMEKLSQQLDKKMPTRLATFDPDKCFSTGYFLPKPSIRNQEKPDSGASGKKSNINTPVHIYPDTGMFKKEDQKVPENTDSISVLSNSMVKVLPEAATQVYLSNLDINRVTCMGDRPIKDVVYSSEKGITAKINGSNAFIKLQIRPGSPLSKAEVIEDPVELYVVCGNENDVYTLIGIPKKIPAQWVQLISKAGNIKKNLALFEGKAFEKKIVTLIKDAWKESYPDSFVTQNLHRPVTVQGLEWMDITLRRIVVVEGEGFVIKEYALLLSDGAAENERNVLEKQFILPRISENPLAISLDALVINKKSPTRLFVIEKSDWAYRIGMDGSFNR